MLHRIVVDVIEVIMKVGFVTNRVFHESRLPYPAAALCKISLGNFLFSFGDSESFRSNLCLNRSPASGIILIARRQSPYRVKMLRHKHDRHGSKGGFFALPTHYLSEYIPCFRGIKKVFSMQGNQGKEVSAARHEVSTIFRHHQPPVGYALA